MRKAAPPTPAGARCGRRWTRQHRHEAGVAGARGAVVGDGGAGDDGGEVLFRGSGFASTDMAAVLPVQTSAVSVEREGERKTRRLSRRGSGSPCAAGAAVCPPRGGRATSDVSPTEVGRPSPWARRGRSGCRRGDQERASRHREQEARGHSRPGRHLEAGRHEPAAQHPHDVQHRRRREHHGRALHRDPRHHVALRLRVGEADGAPEREGEEEQEEPPEHTQRSGPALLRSWLVPNRRARFAIIGMTLIAERPPCGEPSTKKAVSRANSLRHHGVSSFRGLSEHFDIAAIAGENQVPGAPRIGSAGRVVADLDQELPEVLPPRAAR